MSTPQRMSLAHKCSMNPPWAAACIKGLEAELKAERAIVERVEKIPCVRLVLTSGCDPADKSVYITEVLSADCDDPGTDYIRADDLDLALHPAQEPK